MICNLNDIYFTFRKKLQWNKQVKGPMMTKWIFIYDNSEGKWLPSWSVCYVGA